MKKTLIIAAAVATLATGFAVTGASTAEAGWKSHGWYHVSKCKVSYYDPYYGWTVKWVPCNSHY